MIFLSLYRDSITWLVCTAFAVKCKAFCNRRTVFAQRTALLSVRLRGRVVNQTSLSTTELLDTSVWVPLVWFKTVFINCSLLARCVLYQDSKTMLTIPRHSFGAKEKQRKNILSLQMDVSIRCRNQWRQRQDICGREHVKIDRTQTRGQRKLYLSGRKHCCSKGANPPNHGFRYSFRII